MSVFPGKTGGRTGEAGFSRSPGKGKRIPRVYRRPEYRWDYSCPVATPDDATVPDPNAGKAFEEALATSPDETDPLVGAILGSYRIDAVLGRGGMGVVYRGYDTKLERAVAVKTVLFDRPSSRARFQREARAQAKLRHEHVVGVHVVGEHAGLTYLVMDLVPGGSLRDVIVREGKLPEPRALEIADAIAAALETAHAHGLIHRDVKPSNVLVEANGNVLLTDFGLAKQMFDTDDPDAGPPASAMPKSLTVPGSVLGTPAYLAPEQQRGERVDHRADMYALGVTLHEMLCGARPTSGVPLPADAKPETIALVTKLLSPDPEERFPTYAALRAALARARGSERFAPASTWKRAVAFAIDFIVFTLTSILVLSLIAAFARVDPNAKLMWPSLVACVIAFTLSEIVWGSTPGKRAFGLRTLGEDNARPPRLAATARAAIKLSPLALFTVASVDPLLWDYGVFLLVVPSLLLGLPAFGRARRALHDRVTRTRVVRVLPETR